MAPDAYLQNLSVRLADGVARLPEPERARHVAFLRACQSADGGFPGREGDSDLYYTGFALRSLAALDALTPEVCRAAAGFLRSRLTRPASVVDFFSLLYACVLLQAWGGIDVLADSPPGWPERVAAALEAFRTPDGGYGKTAGASSGSTYHTFLVGLCFQLLGRGLSRPEEVARFVHGRRREDGGFVEIAPMRRSGTNPTAAAVGVLELLAGSAAKDVLWPAGVRESVVAFLAAMASPEGGLRANGRAPLADLLSTFTGAWTLHQLGALDRLDTAAVRGYPEALALPGGGFRGGLWDDRTDVEYTFYGLGTLALLS
jgi:geranylgeranyl transferase type-2 subunit beta